MLMFDNSIFASFIPQFLMILGYFSCLIAPAFYKSDSSADISRVVMPSNHVVMAVQQMQQQQVSVCHYFEQLTTEKPQDQVYNVPVVEKKVLWTDVYFDVSQGLSFKLFSRPPPAIA